MAAVKKFARKEAAESALLEELKAAAERLGVRVREERLLREVGYHVRSGRARVRQEDVIFLDRGMRLSVLIDVLVDELATRSVDDIYLSPAARALIERAAAREARHGRNGDAGG